MGYTKYHERMCYIIKLENEPLSKEEIRDIVDCFKTLPERTRDKALGIIWHWNETKEQNRSI